VDRSKSRSIDFKVDRSKSRSIEFKVDRSKSRSIEFKVDRSNFCGAGISETLANSINTILSHFLREEAAWERPRRRFHCSLGFLGDFHLEHPPFVSFL
jgi:hypothetical protein